MNTLVDSLKCTDASIFFEKGKPYLKWTGEAKSSDGTVFIVDIPKMSLDIIGVQMYQEPDYNCFCVNHLENILLEGKPGKDGEWYTISVKEREVSKTQLENELGYKLKLT